MEQIPTVSREFKVIGFRSNAGVKKLEISEKADEPIIYLVQFDHLSFVRFRKSFEQVSVRLSMKNGEFIQFHIAETDYERVNELSRSI